jgi:hypothetical protein
MGLFAHESDGVRTKYVPNTHIMYALQSNAVYKPMAQQMCLFTQKSNKVRDFKNGTLKSLARVKAVSIISHVLGTQQKFALCV